MCDEVFGKENFLGQVSRLTGTPTEQGTKALVSELDYVIIYSKSNIGDFNGIEFDDDKKIYNQSDEKGQYLTRPLRKIGSEDKREDRPSMYYPLISPNKKETLICLDVIIVDETVEYFKTHTHQKLIVLERALDITKKWNLKHAMGDKFNAF